MSQEKNFENKQDNKENYGHGGKFIISGAIMKEHFNSSYDEIIHMLKTQLFKAYNIPAKEISINAGNIEFSVEDWVEEKDVLDKLAVAMKSIGTTAFVNSYTSAGEKSRILSGDKHE